MPGNWSMYTSFILQELLAGRLERFTKIPINLLTFNVNAVILNVIFQANIKNDKCVFEILCLCSIGYWDYLLNQSE